MGEEKQFGKLKFDAKVDFNAKSTITKPSTKKKFILIRPQKEPGGLKKTIEKLLQDGWPGLQNDVSSQFVAFRKNNCGMINDLCCQHYSHHPSKSKQKGELLFQRDDKMCCTRNGYILDQNKEEERCQKERKRKNAEEVSEEIIFKDRLCNGEIFFIKADTTISERGKSRRYLTLDDKHGKKITVDYKDLKRECKPQHAWARTIHTFQGSEVETVVYVVGAGSYQTWRHVYTAVTRGRKRVYVIAEEKELKTAIEWRDKSRKTRLRELLLQSPAKNKRPSSEKCHGPAAKQTRNAN